MAFLTILLSERLMCKGKKQAFLVAHMTGMAHKAVALIGRNINMFLLKIRIFCCMAGNAQILALCDKQSLIIGIMTGMASKTFALLNWGMHDHSFFLDPVLHIIMAEKAQAARRTFQIMVELTSMGIMACNAIPVSQRFMYNFSFFHPLGYQIVASVCQTYKIGGYPYGSVKFSCMWIMAG
jgi:hypothetical protein